MKHYGQFIYTVQEENGFRFQILTVIAFSFPPTANIVHLFLLCGVHKIQTSVKFGLENIGSAQHFFIALTKFMPGKCRTYFTTKVCITGADRQHPCFSKRLKEKRKQYIPLVYYIKRFHRKTNQTKLTKL